MRLQIIQIFISEHFSSRLKFVGAFQKDTAAVIKLVSIYQTS